MISRTRILKFTVLTIIAVILGVPLLQGADDPGASSWVTDKVGARVRLVSEFSSLAPHSADTIGGLFFGLEFRLQPGWHVYWKNPGLVGFPPKVNWKTLPAGWSQKEIIFPVPDRIESPTGLSFGYENNVTYLILLEGRQPLPEDIAVFEAQVDYLICKVQCLPASAQFKIRLPVNKEVRRRDFDALREVRKNFPQLASEEQASDLQWRRINERELELETKSDKAKDLFVFVGGRPDRGAKVLVTRSSSQKFLIQFPSAAEDFEWLLKFDAKNQSSALWGEKRIVDLPHDPESGAPLSLWIALIFAFLGGLILNLMPCVLPVVILKTVGLLKLSSAARSEVKKSLVMTTLGVWTSFLVLAGLLLIMRLSGQNIGWGFHFQSPGFVTLMAFVIFIFGLNLMGVFEFSLGGSTATQMSRWQKNSFLEGVFATILATPCSAPFMGTALTFALAQPAHVFLLTFFSMGLGLSTPYILMILWPGFLKILPKPGAWMNKMKKLLALALFAAVVWLIFVLRHQTEATSFYLNLALFGVTSGILLLVRTSWRWLFISLVVALGVGLAETERREGSTKESVTPFSEALIRQKLSEGQRLFVVVTADWCLTCKFNESTVTETDWFKDLLRENNLEMIVFDWTNPDERIATFLKSHGRVAIPFSMLISAEKKTVLPELLTRRLVNQAIEEF